MWLKRLVPSGPPRLHTAVTSPFLMPHAMLCLVAQSCPTLCNCMDCSLPGSSAHGILQLMALIASNFTEKAMAPRSSTLAWKIPWTEEPGRLQSMGSLRVGHDWATSRLLFTFLHWRRKWQPTPVFLPGESQGRGSLVGSVYGVTQGWTRLNLLSSSSSNS